MHTRESLAFCAKMCIFGGMKRFALLLLPVLLCQVPAFAGDDFAVAVQSVVNMREHPDYDKEMGTQVLMGTVVKVLERDETKEWLRIESPDGYKAWCHKMAVKEFDESQIEEWNSSRKIIITVPYTFFLESPDRNAGHVCDGCIGCIAIYSGQKGRFYCVTLPSGVKAYVPKSDAMLLERWEASLPSKEALPESIIKTAKMFLGIPYLWGGTSIKGVDCSGFTQQVFSLSGIQLPRNSSAQAKVGEPVDVSTGLHNLKPGDLLFFGKTREDGSTRINHVAIYIGGGKIIQSSYCVRINSLIEGTPDYYPRKVYAARRVF